MPPAENGMFGLLLSPVPSSGLMVVGKDDALNADTLAVGVPKMGGRLILPNELTMDTNVIVPRLQRQTKGTLDESKGKQSSVAANFFQIHRAPIRVVMCHTGGEGVTKSP